VAAEEILTLVSKARFLQVRVFLGGQEVATAAQVTGKVEKNP